MKSPLVRCRAALVLLAAVHAAVPPSVASAEEPSARGVLTQPPRLTSFVEAPFPADAPRTDTSVTLAIVIRADGTVEDVTVVESGGAAFDDAAVAAARAFVFEPARIDDVPARIRITYRYDFRVPPPPAEVTPAAPTRFEGVVRDAATGTTIAGVTVRFGDLETTTDDAGRFAFEDVAPGAHRVTLSGPRLPLVQTEESLVEGERLEAAYDVALLPEGAPRDSDLEIVVFAPRLSRAAVSQQVDAEDARRVPGTGGEVVAVVNNMPGVGRQSVGSGAFVVWGASPDDTFVYVDGIRVPRLYHDGG